MNTLEENMEDILNVEVSDTPEGGCTTCLLYTSPSPRDATLSRMPAWA